MTARPGYLARLAIRATQPATGGVRPRAPSLFEQASRTDELESMELAAEQVRPAGEVAPSPPRAAPASPVTALSPTQPIRPARVQARPGSAEIAVADHPVHRPPPSPPPVAAADTPPDDSRSEGPQSTTRPPGPADGRHEAPPERRRAAPLPAEVTVEPPGRRDATPPSPRQPRIAAPAATVAASAAPAAPEVSGPPSPRQDSGARRPRAVSTAEVRAEPVALPRLAPTKQAQPAPKPGVTVTIGRIEVLPTAPESPARPAGRRRPSTAPKLADYLRERRGAR